MNSIHMCDYQNSNNYSSMCTAILHCGKTHREVENQFYSALELNFNWKSQVVNKELTVFTVTTEKSFYGQNTGLSFKDVPTSDSCSSQIKIPVICRIASSFPVELSNSRHPMTLLHTSKTWEADQYQFLHSV